MSQHRGERVKPRYGRLTALGSSLAVTLIAVLGGTGVLPSAAGGDPERTASSAAGSINPVADPSPTAEPETDTTTPDATRSTDATETELDPALDSALPADSGHGKRVVFSESRQRVWLVTGAKKVVRTYLVSGSLTDNLDPGTYAVYSRSEQAWGIDDSGTMKYFVRFTQGDTGAAIGFHDIPVDDGHLVQTKAQLGTPQSHGCIRQNRPDAIALWDFAPLGTTVVVTA
ncbi:MULTISPECIES: L,D-transpeptidase [unclassified Nocardioides]|uniref:L,D-transpeptidase n=1 Tax=unclassified Nocardioides TaxID=2615069 RepID=UPI0009EFC00B|nr:MULTISPECIES: L,D-transpeptidase [unclassified Nocardioides]GAW51901.1 ErfK/YbiS/YcfS/YnhG family protein [Nocardioides sp. PD653-B2]GAW57266.1 ErfK/YbiS/YcfS/YnhG family protein [Nocardioides sp. PD653]